MCHHSQTITFHEMKPGHYFFSSHCLSRNFAYIPPGSHCHRLSGCDMESSLSHGIYSNVAMSPKTRGPRKPRSYDNLEPHENAPSRVTQKRLHTYLVGTSIFCESMQFILVCERAPQNTVDPAFYRISFIYSARDGGVYAARPLDFELYYTLQCEIIITVISHRRSVAETALFPFLRCGPCTPESIWSEGC